eukprot:860862-Prorocentrum_minimum.AAC.1
MGLLSNACTANESVSNKNIPARCTNHSVSNRNMPADKERRSRKRTLRPGLADQRAHLRLNVAAASAGIFSRQTNRTQEAQPQARVYSHDGQATLSDGESTRSNREATLSDGESTRSNSKATLSDGKFVMNICSDAPRGQGPPRAAAACFLGCCCATCCEGCCAL